MACVDVETRKYFVKRGIQAVFNPFRSNVTFQISESSDKIVYGGGFHPFYLVNYKILLVCLISTKPL